MVELLRVEKSDDRLEEGDAGGDEYREDDGVAGPALGAGASEQEGGADGGWR
jgi:hypothetical protein